MDFNNIHTSEGIEIKIDYKDLEEWEKISGEEVEQYRGVTFDDVCRLYLAARNAGMLSADEKEEEDEKIKEIAERTADEDYDNPSSQFWENLASSKEKFKGNEDDVDRAIDQLFPENEVENAPEDAQKILKRHYNPDESIWGQEGQDLYNDFISTYRLKMKSYLSTLKMKQGISEIMRAPENNDAQQKILKISIDISKAPTIIEKDGQTFITKQSMDFEQSIIEAGDKDSAPVKENELQKLQKEYNYLLEQRTLKNIEFKKQSDKVNVVFKNLQDLELTRSKMTSKLIDMLMNDKADPDVGNLSKQIDQFDIDVGKYRVEYAKEHSKLSDLKQEARNIDIRLKTQNQAINKVMKVERKARKKTDGSDNATKIDILDLLKQKREKGEESVFRADIMSNLMDLGKYGNIKPLLEELIQEGKIHETEKSWYALSD